MPVSYIQHRVLSQLLNIYIIIGNNISVTKNNYKKFSKLLLLYDIHPNPGPKYELVVGYTNIRSLFSDTNNTLLIEVQDCKFNDMLREFIYINDCDIIFLTETWLKDEEMSKYQLHINNYRPPVYRNRIGIGGGLLIYYKEKYTLNKIETLNDNNIENLAVELICSNNIKFLFNLIYRSPTSTKQETTILINNIYDSYNYSIQHNFSGIYFIGDFNFPQIHWIRSEYNNHEFFDAISQMGLCQLITEPTRYRNILDLVITDSPGYTKDVTINPAIKNCDHKLILFTITYNDKPIKILPRQIYKYSEANWDIINKNIQKENWCEIFYNYDTIEDMVNYLEKFIQKEMDTHIPSFILSNTKRKTPWMNYNIKKHIILQRRFKKNYELEKSTYNKNKYLNTKHKLDNLIQKAKESYFVKIQLDLRNKTYSNKQFWTICNKLLKRKIKSNIGDIIYNKKIYKDDKDKVRIIGDYFAEQVSLNNEPYDTHFTTVNNTANKFIFPEISQLMIYNIIKNINIHTASGPDKISNIFIKKTIETIIVPLNYIFNYSIIHGKYPKQWKISNWTPLHKKDSIYKRENYRPISLCNNLGKILDKIIFQSLYSFLEKNNLLNKYNYGFKKQSSCQHNLSMLLHKVHENLDNNCDSLILFLDVVKAFDKVDHKILLQKLNLLGVLNKELQWFRNYLKDRYSKCVIHGYESELYPIQTSVTQGSVLATLLWSIFAYDITDNIISNTYIFADDTALVEKIERNDVNGGFSVIQFDIDQLLDWAKINKIEFSREKTKYLIISNSHYNHYPSLHMDNYQLQRVTSYEQLGLFIDENLNWENHINYTIGKVNKILHMLKLIRNRIDFKTSEKIYKGLIASIIDYCCMFYCNATQKNIKRITRLIYHCAIVVVKGNRFLSENKLLEELGWNNFQQRTNYLSIIMFGKIKLNQRPKIIYDYFFLNLPANIGRNIGKLKVIFSKKTKFYNSYYLKMIRLWNTLPVKIRELKHYSDFLHHMHQRYKIHEYKINNLFHYDTEIDNIYLKIRHQCSKLNADQFKLHFVTDPKCNQCNKNKQETNHHYLMDCKKYEEERKTLKENICKLHTALHKLNNRQLVQLILGHKQDNIEDIIYKNAYQFIKLYIVTTGRFI